MLTDAQRKLARHALGLPNNSKRSYRNRYRAPFIGQENVDWCAMHDAGYAVCVPVEGDSALGPFFYLTEAGARLALNKGEKLCPEDFPKKTA